MSRAKPIEAIFGILMGMLFAVSALAADASRQGQEQPAQPGVTITAPPRPGLTIPGAVKPAAPTGIGERAAQHCRDSVVGLAGAERERAMQACLAGKPPVATREPTATNAAKAVPRPAAEVRARESGKLDCPRARHACGGICIPVDVVCRLRP